MIEFDPLDNLIEFVQQLNKFLLNQKDLSIKILIYGCENFLILLDYIQKNEF